MNRITFFLSLSVTGIVVTLQPIPGFKDLSDSKGFVSYTDHVNK